MSSLPLHCSLPAHEKATAVAITIAIAIAISVTVANFIAIAIAVGHRPLPLPWPLAIAVAVAVNYRRLCLCHIAISHCHCQPRCRHPCHRPLPSLSPLAITVAISVGHHCCPCSRPFLRVVALARQESYSNNLSKESLPYLFCDSGQCTDQSQMTDQALSGNGQHLRWVASGKQQAASRGSGWQQGGNRGAAGWRRCLTMIGVVLLGRWGSSH